MKLAGRPGYASARVAVLDAGVVLTRLDPTRRGHAATVRLFADAGTERHLVISTVNLAEVLQHARDLEARTGFDALVGLEAMGLAFDAPSGRVARAAADLAAERDLSLADRFALATALEHGARLHTTDPALASAARRRKVPVTLR